MQGSIDERKEKIFENPVDLFNSWFELAKMSGLSKPDAFCLSSIGDNGFPRTRTVLYKGMVDGNICFYTNYESEKAKEIENNPKVGVSFYWDEPLDCQVRIEGLAEKLSEEESDAYFSSRPRGSQIGAWASPQSKEIGSRDLLEQLVKDSELRFEGQQKVPRPEFWGGYKIVAQKYDFMLMRKDRLHDRYEFRQVGRSWEIVRIAP